MMENNETNIKSPSTSTSSLNSDLHSRDLFERLLQEQKDYYSKVASEYDEWWNRIDRFSADETFQTQWKKDIGLIGEKMKTFLSPCEKIIEFAPGTGFFTQQLIDCCSDLTVLDASEKMLGVMKNKINSLPNAINLKHMIHGDVLQFKPERKYDAVFFGFFLSHIPPNEILDQFLKILQDTLNEKGKVFFVDSFKEKEKEDYEGDKQQMISKRKLKCGDTYNIFKLFYDKEFLKKKFESAGFSGNIFYTDFFIVGELTKK